MLAIAVSSDAIASAVKIAATAQRRSSGGKPSIGAGGFAVLSADILPGSLGGAIAPMAACTTDKRRATGAALHAAYAKGGRRKPSCPAKAGDGFTFEVQPLI